MTPPAREQRVSDEHLTKAIIGQSEYFASFRAGVDCIGGAQAKAGYDALLDLRDCRADLRAAQAQLRLSEARREQAEQSLAAALGRGAADGL